MGNTSTRVKKHLPKNPMKTRSFREKAKKHRGYNKKSEQANVKSNENDRSDEPSTIGKSTMFLGYDSDAEVLDLNEVLVGDAMQIATPTNPLKESKDYNQGKLECGIKRSNETPYLM